VSKDIQDTSRQAYTDSLPYRSDLAREIVQAMRQYGPMTCTEISARIGRILDNVKPTVTHLKDEGVVVKTAKRRPTQYGKPSIVWELAKEWR
jgi:predicted transcriptional regulator